VRERQAHSLFLRSLFLVMAYTRNDDASPDVKMQRVIVDAAYELRNGGGNAYYDYQKELMKLDKLTGGKG